MSYPIGREMSPLGQPGITGQPPVTVTEGGVRPSIAGSVKLPPGGIPSTHTAPPAAAPDQGTHIALGPHHKEYVSQLARNDFSQHSNVALWANISRQDLRTDLTQRLGLTPADAQALRTFDSFSCKARCSLIMLLENKIVSPGALKAWLSNVKTDPAGANAELYAAMPKSLSGETAGMLVRMGTTCREVQGVINMAAAKAMANTDRVLVNRNNGQVAQKIPLEEFFVATRSGTTGGPLRAYLLSKRASILLGDRSLPVEVKTVANEAVRHALLHGAADVKNGTARWLWNNRGKILSEPPAVRLSLLGRLQESDLRHSLGLTHGDINLFIVENRDALLAGLEDVDDGVRTGVCDVVEKAVREVVKNWETSVSTANLLDKWLKDNGMASMVIEHSREWCISRSADDIAKLSEPERAALLKVLGRYTDEAKQLELTQFILRNRDALVAGVGAEPDDDGQAVCRLVHQTMSRVYGDAKTSSKQRGEILQWLSDHPNVANFEGVVDWTRGVSAPSPVAVPAGLNLSQNDQGILRILASGYFLGSPVNVGWLTDASAPLPKLYLSRLDDVPAAVLVQLRPDNPALREFVDQVICEKFVANHDLRNGESLMTDPCFGHLWERRDALAAARPEVRASFAKALIMNAVLEGRDSNYALQHSRVGINPQEWLQQLPTELPRVKVDVGGEEYGGTPAAYRKI